MRIKRKKHLKERLESVKEYILVCERDVCNVLDAIKDKRLIDCEKVFSNANPLSLEIGCGKGGFITEIAKRNPDKNYIAVELLDNIIVMAAENAKTKKLENVRFINSGAEYLPRYIKDGTVSEIYLNFSPPYPQSSYENRRLTNLRYLDVYFNMLTDKGVLYQKTDDKRFFDYSVDKLTEYGFSIEILNEDDFSDFVVIKTEYENKFLSKGMPVYRLKAKKNNNSGMNY